MSQNQNQIRNQNISNNISNTKSSILNLETLKTEYDTVLLQYKKVQADYISFLNEPQITVTRGRAFWGTGLISDTRITRPRNNNNISMLDRCKSLCSSTPNCTGATFENRTSIFGSRCQLRSGNAEPVRASSANTYAIVKRKDPLVQIKGQAFWGTGAAVNSENNHISTVDDCSALCSSTPNCTGATFNNTHHGRNICFLRSGDASPIPALTDDYAIIQESKMYLNKIRNLNTRLTNLNNQILQAINTADPLYNQQTNKRSQQMILLNENYNRLLEERDKVDDKLREFDDLDEKNNNNTILISKNYYSYMFLVVLVIISIIILIFINLKSGVKAWQSGLQSGGSKLSKNTYYIVFSIFLLSLVVYFLKNFKFQIKF